MRNYRSLVSLVVCVMLFVLLSPLAGAVSTTTIQMKLALGSKQAVVNDVYGPELDVPPVLINGQIYLPLKNVSDKLGISVEWNGKTNKVELTSSNVKVQFDIFNKQIEWNGSTIPFDNAATLQDGKLFVRLNWICNVVGARYTYDPLTKQIDIYYLQSPPGLSTDSGNSKPVAKFTFGKRTYRIGEPVKYIDLSYDPDAEGIASYEWSGKQDAFFASGTYPITLKVKDGNGKVSELYSRNIVIEDKIYVTDTLAYKLNFQPIGTAFETNWSEIWGHFWTLPMVPKQVTEDNSRKLLVSDSPETIKETGILYQDKVNGKARLYADHVNGTKDKLQYVIIARNTSLTKEVTIRTTNKGEVYPSIYANLIGHEASVDFLLHDPVTNNNDMTVPPGQALAYVRMPDFLPEQGVNVFYDVETDGEVEFSFVAMNPTEPTPTAGSLNSYKLLDFTGNVRGSFPVSDVAWNVDLTDLKQPSRLIIGDGKDDPFVKGYDTQRKQEVYNEGNYGVVYNIHLNKPPKMAVLILAMGGPFKGPFKINGEFHMVPDSGLLPAFEKIQVLTRTTGDEEGVNIEFTPPAGSAFPIDLIFYPLGDLPE